MWLPYQVAQQSGAPSPHAENQRGHSGGALLKAPELILCQLLVFSSKFKALIPSCMILWLWGDSSSLSHIQV
jgi:hypothetical protein